MLQRQNGPLAPQIVEKHHISEVVYPVVFFAVAVREVRVCTVAWASPLVILERVGTARVTFLPPLLIMDDIGCSLHTDHARDQ